MPDNNNKSYLGRHLIIELYECDVQLLADPEVVEQYMTRTAQQIGATVVTSNFHHFSPLGVSGVVIIQESHLTIHTWPEYGYAAIDIFTCGDIETAKGADLLKVFFGAARMEIKELRRGFLEGTK